MMEKDVTLRERDTLCCPHCGGKGLTVRAIFINHPTDGMVVSFNTSGQLEVNEIDGGDQEGYVSLTVDCPRCSPEGDAFYLTIADGETRAGDFVARAHWSTDKEGDPNSVRMRLIKAFKDAGERGLTVSQAEKKLKGGA
jgi:hypothetical protein